MAGTHVLSPGTIFSWGASSYHRRDDPRRNRLAGAEAIGTKRDTFPELLVEIGLAAFEL